MSENKTEILSKEEGAKDAWHVAARGIKAISNAYQKVMNVTNGFAQSSVGESAQARVTGTAYKAKTYNAMLSGFKNVDDDKIISIVTDKNKSFKEKISTSISYVSDKFDHQSTVATAAYFGKKAVFGALGAGVALAVGTVAPVAVAAAAGYFAYKGGKMGAQWYLSTSQGHHFEEKAGNAIKNGIDFIRGSRRAAKGIDPEYNHAHEVHQHVEALAKNDADHAHGSDHHGADHGDHHHGKNNLLHDVRDVLKSGVKIFTHPNKTALSIAETLVNTCHKVADACKADTSNKLQNTVRLDQIKLNSSDISTRPEIQKPKVEMGVSVGKW